MGWEAKFARGRWSSLVVAGVLSLALAFAGTGLQASSFSTGAGPAAIAGSEAQERAFVLNENTGSVSVVDTETQAELARVPILGPGGPVGGGVLKDLVFLESTGRVYLSGLDGNVYWLDPSTSGSGVLAAVPGASFTSLAAIPGAMEMYVLSTAGNMLYRVTTGGIAQIVSVLPNTVKDLDLADAASHAVVTTVNPPMQASAVWTIDLPAATTVASVSLDSGAGRVRVAGNRAYVVRQRAPAETDVVEVLDLANPAAPVALGAFDAHGFHACVDFRADRLFVTSSGPGGVRLSAYRTGESPASPEPLWTKDVGATASGDSRVGALAAPAPYADMDLLVSTDFTAGTVHLEFAEPPSSAPPEAAPAAGATLVYFSEGFPKETLSEIGGFDVIEEYEDFALVDLTEEQYALLASERVVLDPLPGRNRIFLKYAEFDTPGEPPLPAALTQPSTGNGWYIVQFRGPIKEEWRTQLEAAGLLAGYLPSYAFIVELSESSRQLVAGWPQVHWVGRFHPAYRLDPALGDGSMHVAFFPGRASQGVASLLGLGFTVQMQSADAAKVNGTLAMALSAAQLPSVMYVSRYTLPVLDNSFARPAMAADIIHGRGIDGRTSNQVIAITDSGIWTPHEAFSEAGKLVTGPTVHDYVGDSTTGGVSGDGFGHGTFVACSALGDAPTFLTYNKFDGQAFGARAIPVKVFDNAGVFAPSVFNYVFWSAPYADGARVNNNSFSRIVNTYGFFAYEADQVAWEKRDYLLVMSAGNRGTLGPSTIGDNNQAKNPLTVGAAGTFVPGARWGGSSRGPALDERIKPDVLAPGSPITSALITAGATGYGNWVDPVTGAMSLSATSWSAPQASGAAALVREYFMLGFYPTGSASAVDGFTPSASLVKAVLINGAREATGLGTDANAEGRWPNNSQGWGTIHLDDGLFFAGDARRMAVWDSPTTLNTGQAFVGRFEIADGTIPVEITLTWTDYPGLAPPSKAIVNDFDLVLVAPDGTTFQGNRFAAALNPGYSVASSTQGADRINTVETIHLQPGLSFPGSLPAGPYRVSVICANNAVPSSNFALVVTGDVRNAVTLSDSVGVIGDYNGQIQSFLAARLPGVNVRSYASDDTWGVLRDIDSLSAIVVNLMRGQNDMSDLLDAADFRGKGVVLNGTWYPGLYAAPIDRLRDARDDPTDVNQFLADGPVKVEVAQSHPVFQGFTTLTTYDLVDKGWFGYQTFDGYGGTVVGNNKSEVDGQVAGDVGSIGIRDQGPEGARHVVMGPLGASFVSNPGHWTVNGQRVFSNAVRWARQAGGASATPVVVAVMGDWNGQIERYLKWHGYDVKSYALDDYDGVVADIQIVDVVLLNRAAVDDKLEDLIEAADANDRGLVFLGRGGYRNTADSQDAEDESGLRALHEQTGEPGYIAGITTDYAEFHVTQSSHAVYQDLLWEYVTVQRESAGGVYFSVFDGWDGTVIGEATRPGNQSAHDMVGVKDRNQTGGARQVVLGSFSVSKYGHSGWWNGTAGRIVRNALLWAKNGAL